MLNLRNLTKTFNARTLFSAADMTINYGERVALVGPNGAGKSTLFSLILKTDTPDVGTVERDEWTTLGYLPQEGETYGDETALDIASGRGHQHDDLEKFLRAHEEAGTVNEPEYYEAQSKFDALNHPEVEAKAKKMLRGLGYKEEDWQRPASELSGGWVMRAHLAHLLVLEPDLLLLDEPTNHLDLVTKRALVKSLGQYEGTIVFVSHDRAFLRSIATRILELSKNGKMNVYGGSYDEYVAATGREAPGMRQATS